MNFLPGQKVVFLHEKGGGVIKSVSTGRLIVEDGDGFDREFLQSQVAPVHSEDYKISEEQIKGLNEDESYSVAKYTVTKGQLTGARKPIEIWEIDLHIEEICDSHSGLSNAEILRKQMIELRTFYKKARAKFIRKVVIIHGVGMGVLKDEVRLFLSEQEGLEYYDADFREYGKGATTVELKYS
jgi:hypothetical protein